MEIVSRIGQIIQAVCQKGFCCNKDNFIISGLGAMVPSLIISRSFIHFSPFAIVTELQADYTNTVMVIFVTHINLRGTQRRCSAKSVFRKGISAG